MNTFNLLDRRAFLGTVAATAAGAVATPGLADTKRVAPPPCPASAWKKGPVVLGREGAPGDEWVQNFTCPAEPLAGDRWRLWYSLAGPKVPFNVAVAEGVPGQEMTRHIATLSPGDPADAPLAIGNLPEGWRPVQPVHVVLPDRRHRIYFWAHGPGVHRYLAAESDDGRRYRVLDPLRPCLYHPSDRAVGSDAVEPLGLGALRNRKAQRVGGEPAATSALISNDAADVYRMPDGSWVLYAVSLVAVPKGDPRYISHDNAPGFLRVIDRRTSGDGLNWSTPRRVIERDEKDPTDQQFYFLSVTPTDRGLVGMLGHYRVEAQTMDVEWCWSADGLTWERPSRKPWIERGAPGEPDSYGIYAPHGLIQHDGSWWLFYTGVNTSHNERTAHGKPGNVVRLARCNSIWA